jgi:hypothetical protein
MPPKQLKCGNACREVGVPSQWKGLFNPSHPLFEFVFAPRALQAI